MNGRTAISGELARCLLIVEDQLQRRLVDFHFIARLLNERPLLFQFRFKGINFFLLLLDCPMLFKELVEQHCIHSVVAHAVGLLLLYRAPLSQGLLFPLWCIQS